jgi:hypothetical protein
MTAPRQVVTFVVDLPDDFTHEELNVYVDKVSTVMLNPPEYERLVARRFGSRIATVKVTDAPFESVQQLDPKGDTVHGVITINEHAHGDDHYGPCSHLQEHAG